MKKKKWLKLKDKKQQGFPPNQVKYPFGAINLKKSTEPLKGTNPAGEVTQPENMYDIPSTSESGHSNTFPGKEEDGVWPVSVAD